MSRTPPSAGEGSIGLSPCSSDDSCWFRIHSPIRADDTDGAFAYYLQKEAAVFPVYLNDRACGCATAVVTLHLVDSTQWNAYLALVPCRRFSWKESYDKPRQRIKKQRHHFADKGPHSQRYFFFSVVMYGCESWRTIKNAECQRIDAF